LSRCLASIQKKSTYSNYEIIVVHNGQLPRDVEPLWDQYSLQSVSVPGPFNFSRSINRAVEAARGDHLLFLNDDTEVITAEWIDKLLLYSCQEGIGAAGARLLFPTGMLQHVGIALSPAGPGHPYYGSSRETPGYLNCCQEPRNWIAVTGACLMTPRIAFEAVGGFDETFELNYNDVDFCLRLWDEGYRCVCNPEVELYHYEAMRADGRSPFRPGELAMFNARWQERYPHDPFFVSEPG
jgi:GT2 family glycosyltransferase